jgi:hypothetical protein
MRILKTVFLLLVFCVAAYPQDQTAQQPQTEDLGLNVFSNVNGPIIIVVDAGLAVRKLDSPYVMFMAYMGAKKENESITVNRDDVTMIYKGVEYKMPTVKELTKNYDGQVHDLSLYRKLNKDTLITSRMKFYRFTDDSDFFPAPDPRQHVAADQGSLFGVQGLKTKFYFKNPGFKKGDSILIKVRDKKKAEINGEVVVEFK